MKTMHTALMLVITTLFLGFAAEVNAQSLIEKPKAVQIAEAINETQQQLYDRNVVILKALFRNVNTTGEQQAILDAFGTNAAKALTNYVILRNALLAINPEADIPEADTTVFVANPDGTVTYVAPQPPN